MQLPWFLDEWDSLIWQKMAGVVTGLFVTWYFIRKVSKRRKILRRIERKKASVKESCQRLVELLKKEGLGIRQRDKILSLPIKKLQQELQTGKYKAIEVLRAYQSKAMEENEKINCVVEPIWEAEEQARALDAQTGEKGPLHGIPVSIKEAFYVKNYDCTGGYQYFIDRPREEDAPFVQVLKQQGAVPFVRTNVPQTMMTFDSSNPIFGETLNPHNLTRSPGGSSSGEGALIAAGGSCLGLGNDIGGSIRIPAHMCGVCGLKPTSERLGASGMFAVGEGQTHVKVAAGPLGNSVESLVMSMKALLVPDLHKAWPFVQVTPFNSEVYTSRESLRIGYFTDNRVLSPVPAVTRGVELACKTLQKKGHTVVPFDPPRTMYMFTGLFIKSVFGDQGEEMRSYLDNDILDPTSVHQYYLFKTPYIIRVILSVFVQLLDADVAHTLRSRVGSVRDWFRLGEKLQAYKEEFVAAMKKQNLDAIICPTMPMPAIPLCQSYQLSAAASYTGLFNVLNFPAGVVPVTKVTPKDQSELNDPTIYPAKKMYDKMARKLSQEAEGLPVSVQCAALPYQEELVLRVMKDIQDGVGYRS